LIGDLKAAPLVCMQRADRGLLGSRPERGQNEAKRRGRSRSRRASDGELGVIDGAALGLAAARTRARCQGETYGYRENDGYRLKSSTEGKSKTRRTHHEVMSMLGEVGREGRRARVGEDRGIAPELD
jgi:hypothetical protein